MGTGSERRDARMAMAYQLISILERSESTTFSLDELKTIIYTLVNADDK